MRHLIFILATVIVEMTMAQTKHCTQETKTAQDGSDFSVRWLAYEPATSHGTVFILPPTGGSNTLDRRYAEKICTRGWTALAFEKWTGDEDHDEDFARHRRHFERVRRAFDLVSKSYPQPYRMLGASLGGLYSLSLINRVATIDKAALIVTGAPFSAVITESSQSELVDVKKKRIEKLGIKDLDEYQAHVKEALREWDSIETIQASATANKSILQVLALKDTLVPTHLQKDLIGYLKTQKVFTLNASHFWAIVGAYWYHSNEIADFLTAP